MVFPMNCSSRPYKSYYVLLVTMALSTSGCSDHIFHKETLNANQAVVTDAKQRIITNTAVDQSLQTSLVSRGRITPSRIVCAEPSPDVAQAISQALSTSMAASIPQGPATITVEGDFNYGMSESVAQLGERLGTIQLLRDKMYRACEAYSNGAISATTYTILMSRLDRTMATLMLGEMSAGAFGRTLASLGGKARTGLGDDDGTNGDNKSNGSIQSVKVTKGGAGYTSAPTAKFEGGGGSGAEAKVITESLITKIDFTKGGTGYTSAPTIKFEGGGGSGAEAKATIDTIVTKVDIPSGKNGTGYTSAPTVKFEGGGGSGAEAKATIDTVVSKIDITKNGTGYTSTPTIKFEGGGGSGAEAKAVIDTLASGTNVFTSSGPDQQGPIGAISGRTGSPTEGVVRQLTQMHKQFMEKDDLGTVLDACLTASDQLEGVSPKKLEVAANAADRYQEAMFQFQSESEKPAPSQNADILKRLMERKAVTEKEYLQRASEITLSPLGEYCVKTGLPAVIKVYQDRESVSANKLQLCRYALEQSASDPSWKEFAQQCVSTIFK